jgi:hypothetical protein
MRKPEFSHLKGTLLFLGFLIIATAADAQKKEIPRGLITHEKGAFEGLNLYTPLESGSTYLMDNKGRVVHTWESDYRPGNQAYLLPNGDLLRAAGFGREGNITFHGGGAGYRVQKFDWEGNKLWEWVYASDKVLMHHDIEPMPNGNVLILAWEMKTKEEAIKAGRNPELLRDDELWSEHVLEVKPIYPNEAEVVWEWHLWDHLIQDFDESQDNFGDVAAHPELMDIDPPGFWMDRISDEELEQLEALGYLGGDDVAKQKKPNRRGGGADWLHMNAIAYNPTHDLIALSSLGNNEIYILDHSTTTEEAKTHSGGKYGHGGDYLYRWGNPLAYRLGTKADQTSFAQHDVHWIAEGLDGAGDLLIFNNGRGREGGPYSSVDQVQLPFTAEGGFHREEGKAWGPKEPIWQYTAPNKKDFNSNFISGAQRQPNGNTLICAGAQGTFFEVTPNGKEVWRYVNAAYPIKPDTQQVDKDGKPKPPSFMQYIVFRVYRYPRDYSAFNGKDLTPGVLLTDYLKEHPTKTPLDLSDEVETSESEDE